MNRSLRFYLVLTIILFAIIYGFYLYYQIPKGCPNNLIDERINITCLSNQRDLCLPSQNWADGTTIQHVYPSLCHIGNREGQNVKFLYCEKLKYEKLPIEESGIISKKINRLVYVILDNENYTFSTQTNFNYNTRDLKVISYSCK